MGRTLVINRDIRNKVARADVTKKESNVGDFATRKA